MTGDIVTLYIIAVHTEQRQQWIKQIVDGMLISHIRLRCVLFTKIKQSNVTNFTHSIYTSHAEKHRQVKVCHFFY